MAPEIDRWVVAHSLPLMPHSREQGATRRTVFLIGPIRPESDLVADSLATAAKAMERVGLEISIRRGDRITASPNVIDSIRASIKEADAIVADTTGASPNVMWELGYAQALAKPLVLLTRDLSSIPFDLRQVQHILYDPVEAPYLLARFVEALTSVFSADITGKKESAKPPQSSVMVSYSHADGDFLKRVLIHLRPLERDGRIDLWADTKLAAGDRWREEIRKAVSRSRVAILLVSADFLASDFITTDELPPLLAAAEERGARIIPVIAKPSRFLRDPRLSRFQALNDPILPLIAMSEAEREATYARLAEIVEADLS